MATIAPGKHLRAFVMTGGKSRALLLFVLTLLIIGLWAALPPVSQAGDVSVPASAVVSGGSAEGWCIPLNDVCQPVSPEAASTCASVLPGQCVPAVLCGGEVRPQSVGVSRWTWGRPDFTGLAGCQYQIEVPPPEA